MKVAIVGAGIIGVTSAWFLHQSGHQVVVIERETGPALETSYANGGMVSWGYATPWAAPGALKRAMRWQFERDAPLILHWRFDQALLKFMWRMLANSKPERYERNKAQLLRLGRYSHQNLVAVRESTGLRYDNASTGTLELFRQGTPDKEIEYEMKVFAANGIPVCQLDVEGCLKVEPGLVEARHLLTGGIQFSADEIGDCRLFTTQLAELGRQKGIDFCYGASVSRLLSSRTCVTGLETDQGIIEADAYVIAAGSYSPGLVAPLGIDLPIYPVKGYSLTAPIINPEAAPRSALMDEARKVAITRLGDRLRVAGIAELAGFDHSLDSRHYGVIQRVAQQLFPHAADYSAIEWWCGLRPMTPEGPPIIGSTPYKGLFLNTGHGTLGWTLSCGSAHVLADIISRQQPEIDLEGLTLDRYRVVPS